ITRCWSSKYLPGLTVDSVVSRGDLLSLSPFSLFCFSCFPFCSSFSPLPAPAHGGWAAMAGARASTPAIKTTSTKLACEAMRFERDLFTHPIPGLGMYSAMGFSFEISLLQTVPRHKPEKLDR